MDVEASWREAAQHAIAGCPEALVSAALVHVAAALEAGTAAAHAADLALAFCVARGDAMAARRFDDHVGRALAAAVRAIDGDPAFVDEICQRTRVRLVIGEGPAAAPRIASYRGAGPLRAWVAIAAQRVALNAKRDGRGGTTASLELLAEVVDREPDPELRHLKTLYRVEFRDALAAALAGQDDRRRAVLRLRFIDGLELAQIGRLYRVHESTVSRWITAALAAIGRDTRERLVARLAVTAATADSVARMVQSQLDLSVARLLASDALGLPREP